MHLKEKVKKIRAAIKHLSQGKTLKQLERTLHLQQQARPTFLGPSSIDLIYDLSTRINQIKWLKQHLYDQVFIDVAKSMGCTSHCVSRQVGTVITRDGRILVTGINGTLSEDINCDELFPEENFDPKAHREWSDDDEIHGEMNAINFAAKFGIPLDGATLYCSLQPCDQCSKNIPATGIKRIVFSDLYDRVEDFQKQIDTFSRKGVIIEKLLSDEELEQRLDSIMQTTKYTWSDSHA